MAAFNLASKMAAKLSFQSFLSSLIYKGILASPRLLRREFRAVARRAIVFFCQAKFTER